MNFLKVVDLGQEDRAKLINMGFGELLANPAHKSNKTLKKEQEQYKIEDEINDPLKASTISVNVVCFTTALKVNTALVPKRFFIQMKFFTFPEV